MPALDGSFLYGAVHAVDLPVRPEVGYFGEVMLRTIVATDAIKDMDGSVGFSFAIGERKAVIGENGMDFVGEGSGLAAQ